MTVVDRLEPPEIDEPPPPATPASATSSPRSPSVAAPTSARRWRRSRSTTTSRSRPRRRPRGRSSTGSPRPGSTSSPRSSAARRRPARSPRPTTTSWRAPAPTRPAARPRSRVLCEPHWFGGSVDDLRAVRAAVSVPVLAKEFVVDARPAAAPPRAPAPTLVLLLAVLHPKRALAALVDRALDLGLEPLVEAHDERELERGARDGRPA